MRTLFGAERRTSSPFENPGIPLTDVGLLDFFGGTPTDAGIHVNEEKSMQFATVFRCVTLNAGVIAGFPLKCYRYSDKAEVHYRALQSPEVGLTPFELWQTVMIHLQLWGNAYILKVRNGMGSIAELRPIHPSRVTPKPQPLTDDPSAQPDKIFEVMGADGTIRPYTTYDIMHIMGPSMDGIQGMAVIALARQSIAIGLAADSLAAKLFGNGSLLSGVLTTDRVLEQTQADQLKARWKQKMAGIGHAHDVAILDAGTKFTPIAMPPEDAQFIQSRQWQTAEVCRWFGVPLHLAMEMTKNTSWGSGLEEQNLGYLKFTLRNWLYPIEQRITREITEPRTQYAEFLVDDLLRADTLKRYQAYAFAIATGGFMTRNEARKKENLPPLEGLDEPLVPALAPPMTELAPEETDVPDTDTGVGEADDPQSPGDEGD